MDPLNLLKYSRRTSLGMALAAVIPASTGIKDADIDRIAQAMCEGLNRWHEEHGAGETFPTWEKAPAQTRDYLRFLAAVAIIELRDGKNAV